jgi:anti-sigma-K factor RskA
MGVALAVAVVVALCVAVSRGDRYQQQITKVVRLLEKQAEMYTLLSAKAEQESQALEALLNTAKAEAYNDAAQALRSIQK